MIFGRFTQLILQSNCVTNQILFLSVESFMNFFLSITLDGFLSLIRYLSVTICDVWESQHETCKSQVIIL